MSCITSDVNLVIERFSMGDIAAIPTETVYGLAADAYALMESFWHGPLTLILPIKSGAINPLITGSCPKSRCCARTIARLYEKSPLPNSRGAYVRSSNL